MNLHGLYDEILDKKHFRSYLIRRKIIKIEVGGHA